MSEEERMVFVDDSVLGEDWYELCCLRLTGWTSDEAAYDLEAKGLISLDKSSEDGLLKLTESGRSLSRVSVPSDSKEIYHLYATILFEKGFHLREFEPEQEPESRYLQTSEKYSEQIRHSLLQSMREVLGEEGKRLLLLARNFQLFS